MHVRTATVPDARAIETIRVRTWRAAYRDVLPAGELDAMAIDETRWVQRLTEPPRGWGMFVAEEAGGPVGFAVTGPSRDEGGTGELYAIYVEPEHWSTGAGRALIERCEQELSLAYTEATLWVLEDNPRARRFYERAGWLPDGARKAEERWGVRTPEVRYRKRLSSSRSRS
jgi:GNAT superfamily N-acetyltransferase